MENSKPLFNPNNNLTSTIIIMKQMQLKMKMLFLFGAGIAIAEAQTLNVVEKSGTKTSFQISSVKTLTFLNSSLNVNKKDGSTTSTTLLNIRYLNFASTTGLFTPTNQSFDALVYPNPMQDVLKIEYKTASFAQSATIEIITIEGKVVYNKAFNPQNSNTVSINVSNWEKGMYLVRLNNGKETITKKIIKS